jgi:protein TonB
VKSFDLCKLLIFNTLHFAIDFRAARRRNALIISRLQKPRDRLNRPENLENGPGTPYLCISNQTAARQGVLPGSTHKKRKSMETKKSERASAENKRFLFAEVGLAVALAVVLAMFSYATPDKKATLLAEIATAIDEDDVPVILDTPPVPPQAPAMPVISDDIQIVDDDIQVDDFVSTFEEDDTPVNIMDYVETPVEEEIEEEEIGYAFVAEKPKFNGGDANEFSRWVNAHVVYPEIPKENGVQGRVTLQFTVLKDGSVGKVIVLRGADPALDREAVRVVSSSPKWTPGRQRDRAVNVTYTFPVIFQLR